ncbi:glycosyltransferase [Streptomyces sp. NBC_00028]|uniref:glycosyltransferase n=1 Tax=Streptomyces sp. NBC_00028 TaxID=2975624 RepID=UPI0032451CDD
MTDPLQVTVVSPSGVVGGAELWLLSLLDATDRLAVDAVLLADGPLREEFTRRGMPCTVRPTGRSGTAVLGAAAWLLPRLRRQRPDVLLANGVKAAVVAAPAAWLAGVRSLWAKHDHSFDGPLMTLLAALTDGCVVTESAMAAASRHSEVTLVPFPAPDGAALPRERARRELARSGARLDAGELLLLTVARLVGYKGVDDAIAALAQPGGERWRLAVVGPDDPAAPDERRRLTELAADLGVAHRVDFTGWIDSAWRLLPAADAVAVLTKPFGRGPGRESFGAVAMEAMLHGVPVIATAPGPVADRVAGTAGAPAGITVPPSSSAAVAEALHRLTDADLRASMGEAGRSRAATHPGPRACADLLSQTLCGIARLPGAGLTGTVPVSVLTSLWNEKEAVDRLLSLLLPQLTVTGDEIVVVDDGSTDGTTDRVTAWACRDSRVRLLALSHRGVSAGRNAGVRAAGNPFIACTDAGCDPAPDWLSRLRAAWAEPQPAGVLTGVYHVDSHGAPARAMTLVGAPLPDEARHPGPWTRVYSRFFGRAFTADRPSGRSMAFTREAWLAAGGFPEDLRAAEDLIFGRRAVAAGHRAALVASAEVSWEPRPTLRRTAVMYFRYGQGSGRSAEPRLLVRDLSRAVAYPVALVATARDRRARALTGGAVLAYLSLPVARAVRGHDWSALPLIPLAAAVRDVAKAAGAVHGLAGGLRRDRTGTPVAAPGST